VKKIVTACVYLVAALARGDGPAPVHPVRVCELLRDPSAWRGKDVAVIGRFSYRESGRYMSEEACESPAAVGGTVSVNSLRLSLDAKNAPKLPDSFDIDSTAAGRELKETRKATTLGKFRFGSLEYDRWAVVYGRVEPVAGGTAPAKSVKGLEPAPLVLVYRGDGMVFFISSE
jgi:hypothetical protein